MMYSGFEPWIERWKDESTFNWTHTKPTQLWEKLIWHDHLGSWYVSPKSLQFIITL